MDRDELEDKVMEGTATEKELEEYLGLNFLNKQFNVWNNTARIEQEFLGWYAAVMKPLHIPTSLAYDLFTGEITDIEFLTKLNDKQLDYFTERFEPLMRAYFGMDTSENA